MAAVGSIYNVVLEGFAGSTLVRNVFNYIVASVDVPGGDYAEQIADFLAEEEGGFLDSICDVLHTTYVANRLIVFDWGNLTDFAEKPLSQAGTRTGEVLPRFVAWSFRFTRLEIGKRYGYKRFGPISENDVLGNSPASGILDELATLGAYLGVINVEDDLLLQYVTVANPVQGVTPSYNLLGSASFQRITTQNTRKPFRNV